MKVLHFTTTVGGGGAETMLCNVCEQLSANGVDNIVVSTTSSIGDNSLRERLEKCSRFYDLEAESLLSWKMVTQLLKILLDERPDIVQTWMHTSGVVAGGIALMGGIRNIVWGVHSKELFISPSMSWRKAFLLKMLLGSCSKILPQKIISCSNEGIKIHQRELGYPQRKMIWVANGIDINRFKPNSASRSAWRKELGIPQESMVIGMVGRMSPVKDVPTFLRGIQQFQKERTGVHFVICGEGLAQADDQIRECAKALPFPDQLHWIPYQHQIETVYPLFDWLTLTSLSEACPMALIEAMACGVPCISTDVGDAKFIVDDSGFMIPTQSPKELAETWLTATSLDAESYQSRSAMARKLSESRFSLEDCVSKYQQVYSDLLAA